MSGVLNTDKTLDRKKLAKKAFSSKENTELLNKTIFPFIIKLVENEINQKDKVLIDAPTLFESGIDSICNKTVAVLSDKELRLKRILERDSIDESDALLRINAGKGDDFYLERADVVLYNNENIEKLHSLFSKFLENF